jgi:hypothetical protein
MGNRFSDHFFKPNSEQPEFIRGEYGSQSMRKIVPTFFTKYPAVIFLLKDPRESDFAVIRTGGNPLDWILPLLWIES